MVVKNPVALRLLGAAQRVDPLLDFRLGRAFRIEVGRRQFLRRAGNEHGVVIEPRPRSLVDQEFVQPRLADRRFVLDQAVEHRSRCRPTPARGTARPSPARRAPCARARRARSAAAPVMSAVRSVGAKRADFACRSATRLVDRRRRRRRRRGRRLRAARRQGCDQRCRRYCHDHSLHEFVPSRVFPASCARSRPVVPDARHVSVNARRTVQHRGLGAKPANRRFPHRVCGGFENQVRLRPAPAATRPARARRRAGPRPSPHSRPPCARRDRARDSSVLPHQRRRRRQIDAGHHFERLGIELRLGGQDPRARRLDRPAGVEVHLRDGCRAARRP